MKRILVLVAACLLIALGLAAPAMAQSGPVGLSLTGQIGCTNTQYYDSAAGTELKVISGVSGESTYICGYSIIMPTAPATNVTMEIDYGTGTNCGTGTVKMTPAWGLSHVAPADVWNVITAPTGVDVCVKPGSAVAMQALIYYNQH